MSRFECITNPLMWFMALLLTGFIAGCGGNGGPILGGGGAGVGVLTRPGVSLTVPADAATNVPANTKITATFTKDMLATTLTSTSISVKETLTGNNVGLGVIGYTVGSRTVDFKPTSPLTPGLNYTVTITSAATDLAGSALAGNQAALPAASNYVWTFTAGAADVTPPTITLQNPANLGIGVALNSSINATFSEAMDPSTISAATFTVAASGVPATILNGSYVYDSASKIATFQPSGNLQASTTYIATITNGATDLAGNPLAAGTNANPWSFTTGTVLAPGTVALGAAGSFGIMATAAITSTGNSIINGDVSLEPGTSMTGFPPAIVNGAIHINDTVSAQARNDLLAAYNFASNLPPGITIPAGADLGALYLSGIPPGTYTSGSTMLVATPLVLDAGGNANAVWVFQIGSSLTTTANVTLLNGAQAKNVFWVPVQDATIGVGTTFSGTIVSGRDVTAVTGATINGRILAGATTAGTVALQNATINVPAP